MKRSQLLPVIIFLLMNSVNCLIMFKLKNKKRSFNENTISLPSAEFLNQSLNHFDENNQRTWAQVNLKILTYHIVYFISHSSAIG
jgi:hypothetical protein